MNFSPFFLPHFPGAPKSVRPLLPRRAAAYWESRRTNKLSAWSKGCSTEPGKQKPRSAPFAPRTLGRGCRAQEFDPSSAQENVGQKKSLNTTQGRIVCEAHPYN